MIGIVDYGMGNLLSVYNAFDILAIDVKICRHPEDLDDTAKIVLPGVGAFHDCLRNLKQTGFAEALNDAVFKRGKPILGICLGMQAMATRSFENGEHEGLRWFDADVVRLEPGDPSLRIPQVGWNEVRFQPGHALFAGLPEAPDFYFVHSYYMKCHEPADVIATSDYGRPFTAAIGKNHIFGTQFHPEKSQDYGLKVLENFSRLKA
jgi:glutamine amidotransferase